MIENWHNNYRGMGYEVQCVPCGDSSTPPTRSSGSGAAPSGSSSSSEATYNDYYEAGKALGQALESLAKAPRIREYDRSAIKGKVEYVPNPEYSKALEQLKKLGSSGDFDNLLRDVPTSQTTTYVYIEGDTPELLREPDEDRARATGHPIVRGEEAYLLVSLGQYSDGLTMLRNLKREELDSVYRLAKQRVEELTDKIGKLEQKLFEVQLYSRTGPDFKTYTEYAKERLTEVFMDLPFMSLAEEQAKKLAGQTVDVKNPLYEQTKDVTGAVDNLVWLHKWTKENGVEEIDKLESINSVTKMGSEAMMARLEFKQGNYGKGLGHLGKAMEEPFKWSIKTLKKPLREFAEAEFRVLKLGVDASYEALHMSVNYYEYNQQLIDDQSRWRLAESKVKRKIEDLKRERQANDELLKLIDGNLR